MDSSRIPRGIHRLSTDSCTVCTTARILGTNVGMNCGCCVDNKTCPQAAPIHPRVIPRQSTGGHAVRTGETTEIHSFHRAYYYPCSSSRKFLLKTGCVDKSRRHRTKRRRSRNHTGTGGGTLREQSPRPSRPAQPRDSRGSDRARCPRTALHGPVTPGRSARAHQASRPSPRNRGQPTFSRVVHSSVPGHLWTDPCHADPRTAHRPAQHARERPGTFVWAGPVPVRRRILHTEGRPIRCGETGYGLKSVAVPEFSGGRPAPRPP